MHEQHPVVGVRDSNLLDLAFQILFLLQQRINKSAEERQLFVCCLNPAGDVTAQLRQFLVTRGNVLQGWVGIDRLQLGLPGLVLNFLSTQIRNRGFVTGDIRFEVFDVARSSIAFQRQDLPRQFLSFDFSVQHLQLCFKRDFLGDLQQPAK